MASTWERNANFIYAWNLMSQSYAVPSKLAVRKGSLILQGGLSETCCGVEPGHCWKFCGCWKVKWSLCLEGAEQKQARRQSPAEALASDSLPQGVGRLSLPVPSFLTRARIQLRPHTCCLQESTSGCGPCSSQDPELPALARDLSVSASQQSPGPPGTKL